MFLRTSFRHASRAGLLAPAAAGFAAGLAAMMLIAPVAAHRGHEAVDMQPPTAATAQGGYPAQVLRVIDGDTFVARVRVWPGMDVTTRVRLRGIDAPEMHARCDDERARAIAARNALVQILDEGAVGIAQVGQDKYGGRVDAAVFTAVTPSVSAEMLARGLARRYGGGRRRGWCG
jgi:endonuclease YncB( thermonuclease family)